MKANKTLLITSATIFIGANLVTKLFSILNGVCIIDLDNMNNYYDVFLKEYRLFQIEQAQASREIKKGIEQCRK